LNSPLRLRRAAEPDSLATVEPAAHPAEDNIPF
jgi:hypothetical protein